MWKTLEILHQWLGFWTALEMAMQLLTSCLYYEVCNVPRGAKALRFRLGSAHLWYIHCLLL